MGELFSAGGAEEDGDPPQASSPCQDEEAGISQYEGPIGCESPPDNFPADPCIGEAPDNLNPNEFLPNANSIGLLYARTEADPDDVRPDQDGFQTEGPPDADETDDPDDPNDDAGVDRADARAGVLDIFLTAGGPEDEANPQSLHVSAANSFASVKCVPDDDGGAHPVLDSRSQAVFVRLGDQAAIDVLPGILPPDRTGPFEPEQEPESQTTPPTDGTNVHDHFDLGSSEDGPRVHFNHVHVEDISDDQGNVVGKQLVQQAVVIQRNRKSDPNDPNFDPTADKSAIILGETVVDYTGNPCEEAEGRITIVKDSEPEDPQDFRFQSDVEDNGGVFELDDDGTEPAEAPQETDGDDQLPSRMSFDRAAGEYHVTEEQVEGWNLEDIECQDPSGDSAEDEAGRTATINLADGEEVICTFKNVKEADEAQVTVIKDVRNEDGTDGTDPQDFRFDLECEAPDDGDDDNGGDDNNGRHGDDEDDADGDENDDLCEEQEFELDDDGNDAGTSDGTPQDGDQDQPKSKTFTVPAPSEIEVEEDPANGFTTTASCVDEDGNEVADQDEDPNEVEFDIAPGQHVTCTFVNRKAAEDEDEGQVKVVKQTEPASNQAFEFAFRHDPADDEGERTEEEFTLQDDGERTFSGLDAGEVRVDEEETDGFTTTAECTDDATGQPVADEDEHPERVRFQLAEDQQVTCTFTNTAQDQDEGQVKVVKQTEPPSGQAFEFEFRHDPDGDGEDTRDEFTLQDDGERTFSGLDAGEVRVEEEETDGFATTSECRDDATNQVLADEDDHPERVRFQLAEDQQVTCTFTNREDDDEEPEEPEPGDGQGTIEIRKAVIGDADPDDAPPFQFSGDLGEFQLSHNEEREFTVDAGQIEVTEEDDPDDGFRLWRIECDDEAGDETQGPAHDGDNTARIDLDPGEDITCSFYNAADSDPDPGNSGPGNANPDDGDDDNSGSGSGGGDDDDDNSGPGRLASRAF